MVLSRITQPRRIAARTVASRIAQEMGCEIGQRVGFQIRFKDVSSDTTQLKLMTDGVLLARVSARPLAKPLRSYYY